MYKNKVSCKVNEICESGKIKKPKSKASPEKVFVGYKKKSKKKQLKTLDDKLKEHSKHHSKKHIAQMKKDIKAGSSFKKAHMNAMKSVGK